MVLQVTRPVLDLLHREAAIAAPIECCGILFGKAQRITAAISARNVHPVPQTHFEIDPQAIVDAHRFARNGGPQVLGYYHSHPRGPAHPSATDQKAAARDGSIWAIVADQDVTFWRDDESGFSPLPYGLTDG